MTTSGWTDVDQLERGAWLGEIAGDPPHALRVLLREAAHRDDLGLAQHGHELPADQAGRAGDEHAGARRFAHRAGAPTGSTVVAASSPTLSSRSAARLTSG